MGEARHGSTIPEREHPSPAQEERLARVSVALLRVGHDEAADFPLSEFPTKRAMWEHLESPIAELNQGEVKPAPVAVTMGS